MSARSNVFSVYFLSARPFRIIKRIKPNEKTKPRRNLTWKGSDEDPSAAAEVVVSLRGWNDRSNGVYEHTWLVVYMYGEWKPERGRDYEDLQTRFGA